jgi:2,3-bisphosphoglycerate-dependent phosphoglycerate mutase
LNQPITRLILARHGETAWNVAGRHQGHLDSPLTPRGEAQAHALAERFAKDGFDLFYSSDLGRAIATARIISDRTHIPFALDSRLRERNLGVFHGLTREEMRERFPAEFKAYRANPDYCIPGGQSARDCMNQNVACLAELAERHAGSRVLVIVHGGVLNSVMRHVLQIPLEQPRRYSLANGSVNTIQVCDGKWTLETWGEVSHLADRGVCDDLAI